MNILKHKPRKIAAKALLITVSYSTREENHPNLYFKKFNWSNCASQLLKAKLVKTLFSHPPVP